MATAAQIKQEFLDLYNEQVEKHNATPESDRSYYWYDADPADSFSEALVGTGDIEGLYDQIGYGDGVVLPSGKVEIVKQWGGGDGGDITAILGIGGQYFQLTGYYSSWDGNDFNDTVIEVEPKEVTVVRFFPKKG
jgi:hypothetical protein